MLTVEQCYPGRSVERKVSGPNGMSHRFHRGVVVKVLRKRVRVEWRSTSTAVSGAYPTPTFHAVAPYSTDVNPAELR